MHVLWNAGFSSSYGYRLTPPREFLLNSRIVSPWLVTLWPTFTEKKGLAITIL